MQSKYWHGLERNVNPLGFGCWQLSGDYSVDGKPHGWGHIEEKEAVDLIHLALDEGIQFFDTAAGYGHGRSEEILGLGISTSAGRNNAVICTKIALTENEENGNSLDKNFADRVEMSLGRLRVDCIDVLLLHSPPDTLNWLNFDIGALEELKVKGVIKTYGVSCRSLAGARNAIECNFGTCLEWVFHLLERRPIYEIFPMLSGANMNFIARSPLSRGLFSSQYFERSPEFSSTDFRFNLPADWVNWTINSIRKVESLQQESESLSSIAVKYCLGFEEMSVVIPGIKSTSHLNDFIKASKGAKLKRSIIEDIERLTDDHYLGWA